MSLHSSEHTPILTKIQSTTTHEGLQNILHTTSARKKLWNEIKHGLAITPELKTCINENIIIALKQLSPRADYGDIHNKHYRTIYALASLHYSLNNGDIKFGIGGKPGQLAKENVPQYLTYITQKINNANSSTGSYNSIVIEPIAEIGSITSHSTLVTDQNYLAIRDELIKQGYTISANQDNGTSGLTISTPLGKPFFIENLDKESFLKTLNQISSTSLSGVHANIKNMQHELAQEKEKKALEYDQLYESQKINLMNAITNADTFWTHQNEYDPTLAQLIFDAQYQTGIHRGNHVIGNNEIEQIKQSIIRFIGKDTITNDFIIANNGGYIGIYGKFLQHTSASDIQFFTIKELQKGISKNRLDITKLGISIKGEEIKTNNGQEKGEILAIGLDMGGRENCYQITKNIHELYNGFSNFSITITGTGKPIQLLDNIKHINIEHHKIILTKFDNTIISILK